MSAFFGLLLGATPLTLAAPPVWDFASVGYEAAVRGDVKLVRIGAYAHLQDGVTVSEAFGPLDDTHDGSTIVGHYVTVGPNSVLRACTIEPECVVGAGCSLLEGELFHFPDHLWPSRARLVRFLHGQALHP